MLYILGLSNDEGIRSNNAYGVKSLHTGMKNIGLKYKVNEKKYHLEERIKAQYAAFYETMKG